MTARLALVALGVLVGGIVGFLLGSSRRPRGRTGRKAPKAVVVPAPADQAETEATLPTPEVRAAVEAGLRERVDGEVPEGFVTEAAELAEKIRRTARSNLKRADEIAAERIARWIEEERRRVDAILEDRIRGGVMALLHGLKERRVHAPELVEDADEFSKLFSRKEPGPTWDGTTLKPNEKIPDGTTIIFPPGQFEWRISNQGRGKEAFPADLLVIGSGMDATIVRLDEVQAGSEIRSLTFRDMTIDCGDHSFTDLRSDKPAVIRLERCRVVAFDMGAGGSVMLDGNTAAFYATDCRFEAGFGGRPSWDGNLFRVRSGLLVRCDRCVFQGPFNSVYDWDRSATYRFEGCDFLDMPERYRPYFERAPVGVRFEGCRFTYVDPSEYRRERNYKARSFKEINPDWKDR